MRKEKEKKRTRLDEVFVFDSGHHNDFAYEPILQRSSLISGAATVEDFDCDGPITIPRRKKKKKN